MNRSFLLRWTILGSLAVLSLAAPSAWASGPRAPSKAAEVDLPLADIDLRGEGHALIVVHAASMYDWKRSAKSQLDESIATFKDAGLPVVYLTNYWALPLPQDQKTYADDPSPTHLAYAKGGANTIQVDAEKVTMVGGYMEACFTRATTDLLKASEGAIPRGFVIQIPMKGVYTFGMPGPGEKRIPSMNLAQSRVQTGDEEFLEYIGTFAKRVRGDQVQPNDWSIRVELDGQEVATTGEGSKTVVFAFFDKKPVPSP